MTGQNNFPFIINIGNSIIGVTVLAMPFCFKACGIILGSLMLLLATWLTLVSCQLLLKAGITARRRSYSFLAYFTHGAIGKLVVEIGMIGLQIGTLVAQVVIIGDLGPAIVSKFLGLQNTDNLRTGLIILLCLFIGLPLGMLKDVRMLSNTSTMCIMFYSFFTFYVIIQSIPNLLKGQWYSKVTFWRMEGFFQCLPIFSFAFGCQTQMFIVYDALAEPSLKRMNNIVGSAVNMCAVAYLLVGFFGNVAFCDIEISGDIVNHFAQNSVSDGIKMCFVMSVSVSIPLIVFPCRVSLYNLLFPQKHKEDLPGSGKIPELHFRVITICIIVGSMIIGIMVPNVEFVLGLCGATMGSLICYIFPALFFMAVMASSSEGKWTARMTLICGLTILIASTYITLSAQEKKLEAVRAEDIVIPGDNKVPDIEKSAQKNVEKVIEQIKPVEDNKKDAGPGAPVAGDGVRQEPPNPQAPFDKQVPKDIPENIDKPRNKDKPVEEAKKDEALINRDDKDKDTKVGKDDQILEKVREKDGEKKQDGDKKELDKDKVGKEMEEKEKEMAEKEKKQDEILGKLEQQQEEQQKLIHEQKQILEELKQHKEEHVEKEKVASENKDKAILQPVQQNDGQQLLNQQQGVQQAVQGQQNQQAFRQQVLQNQPVEGQQVGMNQPVAGQQVINQPVAGQQVINQPMAGQQVINQPIGGQQVLNQPMGVQQQFGNQPIGGQQQMLNQPIGNEQLVNQPMVVQQQAVNQLGGQQQVLNQPIGQQQPVQNQPIAQQKFVDGQNILQNQQGLQNQGIMGQQVLQNQPVIQQQAAAGQQQQFGNPNDLIAQNQQPLQQVHQQGVVAQPAVDTGGQLVGNVPVQNGQAVHDGNIGQQNPQGQKPIVPAQQVGDPVRQGFVNDVQQNVKSAKDHDIQIGVNNAAENVQKVGIKAEEGRGANKDDALRRRKRDLGNDNEHEEVIPDHNQNNVDKVIDKDEAGNIQRDLRQIDEKVEPFGDNVDGMIKGVKKDLYLDGNRKSPFVVQMAETNLGVKRR